jgi:hypothetical protein
MLERYFTERIAATESFSSIVAYWESSNCNEIDIVAINEYGKMGGHCRREATGKKHPFADTAKQSGQHRK